MLKRESLYRLIILIALCSVFNRCKKDDDASSPPKLGTPVMATVSPSSGVAGDVITIGGVAFSSNLSENVITIGQVPAQVTQASSKQLTFVIPPEAVGLDSIVLTTPGGSSKHSFTTHATVTDFIPSSGPAGTRVKITGTGLSIYCSVNFNNNYFSIISSTPTELIVALSNGTIGSSGPLTITENFSNYQNGKTITTTKNFSITSVLPVQVASFPGTARGYGPSGFALGSLLFYGLGTDRNTSPNFLNDFWKYDSGNDTWTRVADFPGGGRQSASAFSFNGKGYVLCGGSGTSVANAVAKKDVWQYDPQLNTWKQLSDFPGTARGQALCFVLGQYVYFGTGGSKDFWRYDPANDSWAQKADFGGGSFSDCGGLAIGNLGYVTGGYGSTTPTTWSYDPSTNTWKQLDLFFNQIQPRHNSGAWGHCVGFTLNGIGYAAQDITMYQLIPDIDSSHHISWVGVLVSTPTSSFNSGYCLATGTNAYIWYGAAEFWKFTPPN